MGNSGSNAERVYEGLLTPPDRQGLILQLFGPEVWEMVLSELTIKDLARLQRVSKATKAVVDTYLNHYASTDGRLDHILNLPADFPLLLREKKLVDKVRTGTASSNLACLKIWKLLRGVRRSRVGNCENFPHLNTQYIRQEPDAKLGRDVVVLDSVCWLHFIKRFEDVKSGRYQFSLRMRLDDRLNWPQYNHHDNAPKLTTLRAFSREEAQQEYKQLVCEEVVAGWWKQIKKGTFDQKEKLTHSKIQYDSVSSPSSWFDFVLDPFELESDGAIVFFELKDIDNPWWKSGMVWDYIQLRRLD